MKSLKERLDRIREGFESEAPPEVLSVLHRAAEELRNSGILDRLPAPGDPLPSFSLPDSRGDPVASDELLREGKLVLTFFRGGW